MKQRASAFKTLKTPELAETLASAKVSGCNPIHNKSFGFAVLDDRIVVVRGAPYSLYLCFLSHFMWESVITFYKKGSGKGARHAWTSKAMVISALSYIAVQCYEHIQSRQSPYCFHPMECVATRTRRFHLLPSLAFLCVVPPSSLEAVPSGDILKLQPGPFSDVFQALL